MTAAPTVEEALAARDKKIRRQMMSSSREVYYVPESGWVYKFDAPKDKTTGWKQQEQNRVEREVYMYLAENPEVLPPNTAVPEMVLLETDDPTVEGGCILASRYVEVINTIPGCVYWENRCECYGTREECWWEAVGGDVPLIEDLYDNVFYDKNAVYWLLDLGYGSDTLPTKEDNR